MTHSYSKMIKDQDCSEGDSFRTAINMASRINWREGTRHEVDPRSKAVINQMKAEANRNFKNERIIHIR